MSTELRVLVAHLGELSTTQGAAAAAIRSASAAADGVDTTLGATHGSIAAATATAAGIAARARRDAGARVEQVGRELQEHLRASAASYTETDEATGATLGGTVGPEVNS